MRCRFAITFLFLGCVVFFSCSGDTREEAGPEASPQTTALAPQVTTPKAPPKQRLRRRRERRLPPSPQARRADSNEDAEKTVPEPAVAEAIKEVGQAWIDAVNAKDLAACRRCVVSSAHSFFQKSSYPDLRDYLIGAFLGEAWLYEYGAFLAVKSFEETDTERITSLVLEQERGQWLLVGVWISRGSESNIMPFIPYREFTGRIAEALATGMAEAFQEAVLDHMVDFNRGGQVEELHSKAEFYADAVPMDAMQYALRWLNMKDYRGQSALEAITALAGQVGLEVDPGDHQAALAHPLAHGLKELTFLEAIDQAAREAGLMARFPVREGFGGYRPAFYADTPLLKSAPEDASSQALSYEPAITFSLGERRYPLAFYGPFVLGVEALKEDISHGLGELNVLALGYGLAPFIARLAEKEAIELVISEVLAPSGKSLTQDIEEPDLSPGLYKDGILQFRGSTKLFGLHQEIGAIGEVESKFRISLPQKVATVHFDRLEVGMKKTQNDMLFEILEISEDRIRIKLDWPGVKEAFDPPHKDYRKPRPPDSAQIIATAVGTDGLPVGFRWESVGSSRNGGMVCTLQKGMPIASLSLYVLRDIERVLHLFQLKDIPLKQSNERPEGLIELTYEGHESPISLELISKRFIGDKNFPSHFGSLKAKVSLRNHSNKGLLEVHGHARFHNARGTFLGGSNFSIKHGQGRNGAGPRLLLAPGASQDFEVTLEMVDAKVKQLDPLLKNIVFMDGSTWNSDRLDSPIQRY